MSQSRTLTQQPTVAMNAWIARVLGVKVAESEFEQDIESLRSLVGKIEQGKQKNLPWAKDAERLASAAAYTLRSQHLKRQGNEPLDKQAPEQREHFAQLLANSEKLLDPELEEKDKELLLSVIPDWEGSQHGNLVAGTPVTDRLGKLMEAFQKLTGRDDRVDDVEYIMETKGNYKGVVLDGPAQILTGQDALKVLLLASDSALGSKVNAATRSPPDGGFQPVDWEQTPYKPSQYNSLKATSVSDLEKMIKQKMGELDDSDNDFVVIKSGKGKDVTLEVRWAKRSNNTNTFGHGSFIGEGERGQVKQKEIEVWFAGQFVVKDKQLSGWDNKSGHFQPTTATANAAPFPVDKFQSMHVDESLKAIRKLNEDLIILLIDEVLPEGALTVDDIEHLVGGEGHMLNYSSIDMKKLADSEEQRGFEKIKNQISKYENDFLNLVEERAKEILEGFTGSPDIESTLPTEESELVNAVLVHAKELMSDMKRYWALSLEERKKEKQERNKGGR